MYNNFWNMDTSLIIHETVSYTHELMFLLNVISGLFLFVTIIGAPFGIQAFKLAQLSLNPVGKKVVKTAVAKEVEAALARKDLSN